MHPLVAGHRERRGVGGEVDRLGAVFAGQLDQLTLGLASRDHEVPAALLERAAQVLQALEHELRARPGRVPAVQERVVEHEHRHHALVGVQRRAQRRVVVHAQVAPEPDDRGRRHLCSIRDRLGTGIGAR